jgi:hypothetical protein
MVAMAMMVWIDSCDGWENFDGWDTKNAWD